MFKLPTSFVPLFLSILFFLVLLLTKSFVFKFCSQIVSVWKYNGFYRKRLYPMNLLNSFISSNKCVCVSVDSFIFCLDKIVSPENRDNFTSSFPIWMPFISFSILIALTITSSTVLNRSSESGHLVWLPVLGEKLSVFLY